jgi:uncharacterized caspase-like protein
MAEQKLHGCEVARSTIRQHGLCPYKLIGVEPWRGQSSVHLTHSIRDVGLSQTPLKPWIHDQLLSETPAMMRFLVFLLLVLLPTVAHAQRRVALVVGNSAYKNVPPLPNPRHDAGDIAAALKAHGFEVLEGLDLDKVAFERKLRDFATSLRGAEAGLFFFAGHGLQVGGQNYLVPIDSKAEGAETLDLELVRLDVVQRLMELQTSTNIIFLDACRDNPLARNLARTMGTRSSQIGRGLAVVEGGIGTLISFSTQPGNVALDGSGRNSPYAGSLVRHLTMAQDDISAILIAVRNDVMQATQRKQVPWEHSALTGKFYISLKTLEPKTTDLQALEATDAAKAWSVTKDTASPAILDKFIRQFGSTAYGNMARARLTELRATTMAKTLSPQSVAQVAGVWSFIGCGGKCRGRVILKQVDGHLTGSFFDTTYASAGVIEGTIKQREVRLTRTYNGSKRQEFILQLSEDQTALRGTFSGDLDASVGNDIQLTRQ